MSNLVQIFRTIGMEVYLISGGDVLKGLTSQKDVWLCEVPNTVSLDFFPGILNHARMQLRILTRVMRISAKCDIFLVFLGESLTAPILMLKILGKRVELMLGITPSKAHFVDKTIFSKLWAFLIRINIRLANHLIVYSNNIIQTANLTQYQRKILLAHEHQIDFTEFHPKNQLTNRACIVGYIGRFCTVKGVLNFAEAMPLVFDKNKQAKALMCGDGELHPEIKRFAAKSKLDKRFIINQWIPHNELPNILNKLKLLVLPSYSEALPNILLEAMACGTPVLATSVGAVPDIIEDGETGFLLQSNEPQHIAAKIIELLNKPEMLERVGENACRWVRENFNQETTIKDWQQILSEFA